MTLTVDEDSSLVTLRFHIQMEEKGRAVKAHLAGGDMLREAGP